MEKFGFRKVAARGAVCLALAASITVAGTGAAFADTGAAADGAGVDKATQMTVTVTNGTTEDLTLVSASHADGVTHWQKQAQQTLAKGTSEVVTDYGSGDNSIDLTYKGATTGDTYKFDASDPLIGDNSASGSTTNTSYDVNYQVSTGHDDHTEFTIDPGHTFQYTGGTQTYVVPAGVTKLNVEAIGGGTQANNANGGSTGQRGAQVNGTLAVTPGETLLFGVGGKGGNGSQYQGGWGMTFDGNTYNGGNTTLTSDSFMAQAGGGASVLVDSDSQSVIVVAGGAGGVSSGGGIGTCRENGGGDGGHGNSWTGGNGGPFPGGGGQAGANTSTQGQNPAPVASCEGGAGGGGVKGGLAGADGAPGGGGAGSSAAPGLTGATVTTDSRSYGQNGEIIITAAN